MNEDIMQIMNELDSSLYIRHTNYSIVHMITIARVVATGNGLTGTNIDLGLALLSLDLLSTPERNGITSKRIKGVEIQYSSSKSSYSKWKSMYDSLVNGIIDGELSLHYVGI